jgi:hypothetical protein
MRPKYCSLCTKMRKSVMDPIKYQGSEHRPDSTPEKITMCLICSLRKGKDGKEFLRCLVWTDTWLKRDGKWQIIAAQDVVVECPH